MHSELSILLLGFHGEDRIACQFQSHGRTMYYHSCMSTPSVSYMQNAEDQRAAVI